MNTRHQIVNDFTKKYAKATKREKGILLDYLARPPAGPESTLDAS